MAVAASFGGIHPYTFIHTLSSIHFHSLTFIHTHSFTHFHPLTFIHTHSFTHFHPLTSIHPLSFTHFHSLTFIHPLSSIHFHSLTFIHSLSFTHFHPYTFIHSLSSIHFYSLTNFHSLVAALSHLTAATAGAVDEPAAVHITINLIYTLYTLYYYTSYIVKTTPSLFKGHFWTKKKQQNAPLACEVCVFLTERNLKLRKIAGKARAARSRCACGAYLYIQILDIEMSYFKRRLLRSVCGLRASSATARRVSLRKDKALPNVRPRAVAGLCPNRLFVLWQNSI